MIIVNPGTGPVAGANIDHAYSNMSKLIEDAGLTGATFTRNIDAEEDDGRFSFFVAIPGGERFGRAQVDMPGIPLDKVRWMDEPGQNIWHFPRLYVDGSSWVWFYAVSELRDWVKNHEEHEESERKRLAAIREERNG